MLYSPPSPVHICAKALVGVVLFDFVGCMEGIELTHVTHRISVGGSTAFTAFFLENIPIVNAKASPGLGCWRALSPLSVGPCSNFTQVARLSAIVHGAVSHVK